jgi:hypothetical protein
MLLEKEYISPRKTNKNQREKKYIHRRYRHTEKIHIKGQKRNDRNREREWESKSLEKIDLTLAKKYFREQKSWEKEDKERSEDDAKSLEQRILLKWKDNPEKCSERNHQSSEKERELMLMAKELHRVWVE